MCYQCSYRCAECSGTVDNCQSCPEYSYRELGVDNSCSCPIGSYDQINNPKCLICHYTCMTCNGSSLNQCTSCNPSSRRNLDNLNQCLCVSKYYDDGKQSECQGCDGSCLTCKDSSLNCSSCKTGKYLDGNSCKCLTKLQGAPISSYQIQGKQDCQNCHFSCLSCNGSSATQCTSCLASEMRELQETSCVCIPHYFNIGKPSCQICNYKCETCDKLENYCLTCSASSVRVLNNSQCLCPSGYFDDGLDLICQKCHYSCLQCSSISKHCDSCTSTSHRYLDPILFNCRCLESYYDSGIDSCEKCHYSCFTCNQNGPESCNSCIFASLSFRVLNQNICQSLDGYFDDGFSSNCMKCSIKCLSCNHTADFYIWREATAIAILVFLKLILKFVVNVILVAIFYCTSCKPMKILTNNICQCVDGTYESGDDHSCLFCHPTCLTCFNTPNYCTTCSADNFRIFQSGNVCICQNGFYEDSLNLACKQCDISCLTCSTIATYCTSCDPLLNLNLSVQNECVCQANYFFNYTSKKCQACNSTCKECKEMANQYISIKITLNVHAEMVFICQKCMISSMQCSSCEPLYFRILNITQQCICQEGYYDIGIEMCQKCNNICKTCQSTSTYCQSCFEAEQHRILSLNACTCQIGYFDNGQFVCQKCSNSCLTCNGRKDNCTSCDTNQFRIDQSIIKKCPCMAGFYSDVDEICQKCNIKCNTCQITKDNCTSCQISQFSNRFTIFKNCNCKDGYYDDGITLECKKCSYPCKICQISSTNCQLCSSKLRNIPPTCDCQIGYFENHDSLCEPCQFQCQTCKTIASNCLTCKEGRVTKLCLCQDGYFEAQQILCIQCENKCLTCSNTSTNCLQCKGDRVNNPNCICPDGFYDDLESEYCLQCPGFCRTCNLQGCLSCLGNRMLTTDMICDEPLHSKCHFTTPWCSTCEVAILQARLSDDLLSIQISFDFPLNRNYFMSQFQENICSKIFSEQTQVQLGKSPQCYLLQNDDTIFHIKLGHMATIIPGDHLIFQEQKFGFDGCLIKLSIFIFNQLQKPLNPYPPKIDYDIPTYILNPCDENAIYRQSQSNNGLRNLQNISWTYQVIGSNGNGDLDSFIQILNNFQLLELIIPFDTLPKQSSITFVVNFKNFVLEESTSTISVQTHSGKFPTILLVSKQKFYSFENVILQFLIRKKDCSDQNAIIIDNSNYLVQLFEVKRNDSYSRPSKVNFSALISQTEFNVTVQSYLLTPKTTYTFQQNIVEPLSDFSTSRNITIEIISAGILCMFNGTKKQQNYRKDTYIQILCKDLDQKQEWNQDKAINFYVQCIDLVQNRDCFDIKGKAIKINETDYTQIIPSSTIAPFSIQTWQVVVWKNQQKYNFNQNIVFLEDEYSLLEVNYNQGYLMRAVNNYENLEFNINIPFENRQYLLEYYVAFIYNYQIINVMSSQYNQYQFRIFDIFQQFDNGKIINLKFLAQFTDQIMPNQADLNLTVNLQPNCYFAQESQNAQALKPIQFIVNCDFNENYPLQFQMRYFISYQDYKDFENLKSDYSLILNSYQASNIFKTFLPSNSENIIMIQAMDSQGSYTNIYKQVNVAKDILDCTNAQFSTFIFQHQIALLLEILLNHQEQQNCMKLSIQLISNIKNYFISEKLNDQLLAYQTLSLYKRLIFQQDNLKSKTRLLTEQSQIRCFNNLTQTFQSERNHAYNYSTNTQSSLIQEIQYIKNVYTNLNLQRINLENEIFDNEFILDEKLFQKKQAVIDALSIMLLYIDDVFVKILKIQIKSPQEQNQLFQIAQVIFQLVEKITKETVVKAKVNDQQLTIQGQILKWSVIKLTKDTFDKLFDLEKELLDAFVDFVQKEELDINFNPYNLSTQFQNQLSLLFNQSTLEIDEQVFKKTRLQNHLYDHRYVEYLGSLKQYAVDMIRYPKCLEIDQKSDKYIYFQSCVQINGIGEVVLCKLLVEESDNTTVQVSCLCQQIGSIILVRYSNHSTSNGDNTQRIGHEYKKFNTQLNINEQPIILFHGIFMVFVTFCFLSQLGQKKNQSHFKAIYQNQIQLLKITQLIRKKNYYFTLEICMFIKNDIHELLSVFFFNSAVIRRSFTFLQPSLKISFYIPIICFEIGWLINIPIFAFLIMNALIFLIIKIAFKILQVPYRFKGGWRILIVLVYLSLHIFSYCVSLILIMKCDLVDFKAFNQQISLILVLSLFINFLMLEPIMIYFRIIIMKFVIEKSEREPEILISTSVIFLFSTKFQMKFLGHLQYYEQSRQNKLIISIYIYIQMSNFIQFNQYFIYQMLCYQKHITYKQKHQSFSIFQNF
ncbi:unnamed protein product [Paramecium octaurelia]|uniref:EGF-like domain-containing protein n=1 Tax=Paramecium octaurelia TaxID=43137 RepID=A0A8S1UPH6_PAROT|nr:unnamed protein product [Paramecium octaurelia]